MTAARCSLMFLVFVASCSGGSGSGPQDMGPVGKGTVAGMVMGTKWTSVSSAFWIGKPGAGSPPGIFFLFESPTNCSAISLYNWDKVIGNEQVLEFGVKEVAAKTFSITAREASAAYLHKDFNPDADDGTVTITSVMPNVSLTGTYDLKFGTDSLKGSFEAAYCANGVEP
jgi:hypothetical protein